MSRKNNSLIVGVLICLIFGLSLGQSSATFIWQEDFENPPYDEWYLQSYNAGKWVYPFERLDKDPIIANGSIHLASSSESLKDDPSTMFASAVHNSSVAYGTWSFDFYIPPDQENDYSGSVMFIANNYQLEKNVTGRSYPNIVDKWRSYNLYIISGTEGWGEPHSITLQRYIDSGIGIEVDSEIITDYQFTSTANFTGFHHVDITREDSGLFKVYFDSILIIEVINNEIKTSEVLELVSFMGTISFDNLTVSDEILPPLDATSLPKTTKTTTTTTAAANGVEFGLITLFLVFTVFFFRKRRY